MVNTADNTSRDEFSALVRECIDILDENVSVLADIEFDLRYEHDDEDELRPDMQLHNLYDMADDVAESQKLKRAEFSFSQRQFDNL